MTLKVHHQDENQCLHLTNCQRLSQPKPLANQKIGIRAV